MSNILQYKILECQNSRFCQYDSLSLEYGKIGLGKRVQKMVTLW